MFSFHNNVFDVIMKMYLYSRNVMFLYTQMVTKVRIKYTTNINEHRLCEHPDLKYGPSILIILLIRHKTYNM